MTGTVVDEDRERMGQESQLVRYRDRKSLSGLGSKEKRIAKRHELQRGP